MSGTTSESSKRDVLKHAIGQKRTTALAAEPEHTQGTSARICDPALACFWLYATAVDFGYPSREARWILGIHWGIKARSFPLRLCPCQCSKAKRRGSKYASGQRRTTALAVEPEHIQGDRG